MRKGFFITASLLLLFGLLLLSIESPASKPILASAQGSSLQKADSLTSSISYAVQPFLPEISRSQTLGESELSIRETLPSTASAKDFNQYASLLSDSLAPLSNSELSLTYPPSLSVPGAAAYSYTSSSRTGVVVSRLSQVAGLSLKVTLPDTCENCISGSWQGGSSSVPLAIFDSAGKQLALPQNSSGSSLSLKTSSGTISIRGTDDTITVEGAGAKFSVELVVSGSAADSPVLMDAVIKTGSTQLSNIAVG